MRCRSSLGNKRAVRKRVVLANVPSFRFSFQGNTRMYPRSGFRSGRTSECTLVPVSVPGEHPPKPPFWQPPFCQPQISQWKPREPRKQRDSAMIFTILLHRKFASKPWLPRDRVMTQGWHNSSCTHVHCIFRNLRNYQYRTEGKKCHQNSAPVLVITSGKSLALHRKLLPVLDCTGASPPDASAPVVVKTQSPKFHSWCMG